jgi:hypothetical protein
MSEDFLGYDYGNSENNELTEKLVLVVDRGDRAYQGDEKRYIMKFFDKEQEVLNYVSNMSSGEMKVHRIFILDHNGSTKEKTIQFIGGQLELINVTTK